MKAPRVNGGLSHVRRPLDLQMQISWKWCLSCTEGTSWCPSPPASARSACETRGMEQHSGLEPRIDAEEQRLASDPRIQDSCSALTQHMIDVLEELLPLTGVGEDGEELMVAYVAMGKVLARCGETALASFYQAHRPK